MKLIKQCKTCEFNFGGTCAGNGDAYGEEITDATNTCNYWNASLEYFTELTKTAPWFIRNPMAHHRLDFADFMKQLEDDGNGLPVKINVFDAIEEVYGISQFKLPALLGVKDTVLFRAKSRGTPEKRILNFSQVLCIPPDFLRKFTNLNLMELEECKKEFAETHRGRMILNSEQKSSMQEESDDS